MCMAFYSLRIVGVGKYCGTVSVYGPNSESCLVRVVVDNVLTSNIRPVLGVVRCFLAAIRVSVSVVGNQY